MKVVPKLLKWTHLNLGQGHGQGLGGSTLPCMIFVVKIRNIQPCHHHYHILTRPGHPGPTAGKPIMSMIGAITVTNMGFRRPKVHLGLQTRPYPTGLLPQPRVYVGIASLGLTLTFLATWRIHIRSGLRLGHRVPRSSGPRAGPKVGYHWMKSWLQETA